MGYLRVFRINLSQIDKGFCLILDDLEKNYRESRDARGALWRSSVSEFGLRRSTEQIANKLP